MKHGSKFVCLMLALLVVLAMSVPAFAAGSNKITVTGAQAGETYNIYKMLDLSVNADKTAYTYTVNEAWEDFFTGTGAGVAYVNIDSQGYVTWQNGKDGASDMEAFAKAAAAFVETNKVSPAVGAIKPDKDGDIVFESLDSGYYLITSTNGTLAMIRTTPKENDVTVNEKNPDSTIDKKVEEDKDHTWGKNNDAQIGDTVNFQTTIIVKHGAKNYVMHDKMDDGLTFNPDSVAIEGLKKGIDYTVVTDDLGDGCTFEVRFSQAYLDTIKAGEDVTRTVTYNAVLNEKAQKDNLTIGEKNDAKLTWGNNSGTEWSETTTRTHQFAVLKYDGKKYDEDATEKDALAGAVFQLKDAAGNVIKLVKIDEMTYRVANGNEEGVTIVDKFETVATGKITIIGVDSDTYFLEELTAPAGFNKLENPVTVVVGTDNALVVEVANSTGTELPITGGIGTTIFYVAGSVLVLGAVVVLVTRRRMSIKK